MDERQKNGGNRGNQHTGGSASLDALPRSSAKTAELIGTSPRKVEKLRTIDDAAKTDHLGTWGLVAAMPVSLVVAFLLMR